MQKFYSVSVDKSYIMSLSFFYMAMDNRLYFHNLDIIILFIDSFSIAWE